MKILSICGSPRKGNSEAILNWLKPVFEELGAENEIMLLRQKNIQRCKGCVEYCNHKLKCKHDDDMADIMGEMMRADCYVFALPNYFGMPPAFSRTSSTSAAFFTLPKQTCHQKEHLLFLLEQTCRRLKKMFAMFPKTFAVCWE